MAAVTGVCAAGDELCIPSASARDDGDRTGVIAT
jgi:hypothetical protein